MSLDSIVIAITKESRLMIVSCKAKEEAASRMPRLDLKPLRVTGSNAWKIVNALTQ